MTDARITEIFDGAGDFIRRELECSGFKVYAYAIDGLTAGANASEYIFKPITQHLAGATMEELYKNAHAGMIYNKRKIPTKEKHYERTKGHPAEKIPGAGRRDRGTSAPHHRERPQGKGGISDRGCGREAGFRREGARESARPRFQVRREHLHAGRIRM